HTSSAGVLRAHDKPCWARTPGSLKSVLKNEGPESQAVVGLPDAIVGRVLYAQRDLVLAAVAKAHARADQLVELEARAEHARVDARVRDQADADPGIEKHRQAAARSWLEA